LTKSDIEGGAGFSTQWDANFVHPIRDVITQPEDAARDMNKVRDALYHHYNDDAFQRVVYTESHDEVANGKSRIPSEVAETDTDTFFAQKRSTLCLALTLTAPGIPMLFQGQEFLEDGWFQDHEELDWDQAVDHHGIIKLTAKLIRLRLNQDGNTKGLTGSHIDIYHVNHGDKVIAYARTFDAPDSAKQGVGDQTVVIANFANQHFSQYEFGLPAGGRWTRRFSSDRRVYSEDFGGDASGDIDAIDPAMDGQPHRGRVDLPPYTVLIYSR
jgi:1,4-alpha-glucan branching enzyme